MTSTRSPYYVPTRNIAVTEHVIANSEPNAAAACVLAQALRMQLGARSIHVTADFIRFNAMGIDGFDGQEKLMRYVYPTPQHAGGVAEKFDVDADTRGVTYAREQVKPFKFILQGEHATSRPVEKRPFATKRGPTRNRIVGETKAVACKRRYHGKKTFIMPDAEQTAGLAA